MFNNPREINQENLKLRPIISTYATYYYETSKLTLAKANVISQCEEQSTILRQITRSQPATWQKIQIYLHIEHHVYEKKKKEFGLQKYQVYEGKSVTRGALYPHSQLY